MAKLIPTKRRTKLLLGLTALLAAATPTVVWAAGKLGLASCCGCPFC